MELSIQRQIDLEMQFGTENLEFPGSRFSFLWLGETTSLFFTYPSLYKRQEPWTP